MSIIKIEKLLEKFNDIYQQHYSAIYRLVFGFVWNEDAAADIVQDVFAKLWTQMQADVAIDFPKTWLSKVAANESLNFLSRTRKLHSLDEANAMECRESDRTEEQIAQTETQRLLRQALDSLNAKEKVLLTLYSESFSYKEISEISGVGFSSIGKLIARALKKLKQRLEHNKNEMFY